MTDWQTACVTAMAGAMVIMAIVQVLVLAVVTRMGRQATETAQQVQRELRPLVEKAHRITDDAAKVTALTLRQVERIDQLVTTTSQRIDDTLNVVQTVIVEPLRQGRAFIAGLQAVMEVIRAWRQRDRPEPLEEEGGLFVG